MQRQAIDAIALGDMTVVGVDTLKGGLGTEQYFIWTFNTLVSGYKLLKLSSTTSRLIVQPLAAKMVVISYAQSIRLRQRVAIALIQNPLNPGTDDDNIVNRNSKEQGLQLELSLLSARSQLGYSDLFNSSKLT